MFGTLVLCTRAQSEMYPSCFALVIILKFCPCRDLLFRAALELHWRLICSVGKGTVKYVALEIVSVALSPEFEFSKVAKRGQEPFFLPKINKVFLRPILQNLKGRSVLDKFFLKWSFRRAESDATKQKILSLQEVGQKRKIVVKIEFTPLSLSWPQNFSL